MNAFGLALRSLRHYWRTQLGVLLGVAIASAVLVGALAVGDSVRGSLRDQALQRIGRIQVALLAGDRFVRNELAKDLGEELGVVAAPTLQLRGLARGKDNARAGIVDVLGVDERFFELGPSGRSIGAPAARKAWINAPLAAQLSAKVGDSILVRVEKPSYLPRDMVMSTIDDVSFALRVEVDRVLGSDDFGRFGLRASQLPGMSVYLRLDWLQKEVELEGANLVLLGSGRDTENAPDAATESGDELAERAQEALKAKWTARDAQLRVREFEGRDVAEIVSERIFIEPAIRDAIRKMGPRFAGSLTYFVNAIRHGDKSTPYSMVAGLGPLSLQPPIEALKPMLGLAPQRKGPNDKLPGIVVNEWLAKDLGVAPGAKVELDYFVVGPGLKLVDKTQAFVVRRVEPLSGAAADRDLMPEFPGLHDSEHCRDWDPGIPMDLDKIRDHDEKYWEEHKGTPKAFVELGAASAIWGNRFGDLTAIRVPKDVVHAVFESLPRLLDPASVGLHFRELRDSALAASASPTDFGGLFLALSFFLILAALLLTAMLFVFGVEQRASEIGVLLATGHRPKQVRRRFLVEALLVAGAGALIGSLVGLGYTRAVLYGLGTLWRGAVADAALSFAATPSTIVTGIVASVLAALFAIFFAMRKAFRHAPVALLKSKNGLPQLHVRRRVSRLQWILIGFFGIAALAIALGSSASAGSAQAAAFFGAGSCLLIAGILVLRAWLLRGAEPGAVTDDSDGLAAATGALSTRAELAARNSGRRLGRSVATIALLASGTFLVVGVQANRLEAPADWSVRASGTGGFALFGRSTIPVLRDLDSEAGREAYVLEDSLLEGVSFVPLRQREGDDASCLNLNAPQNPQLLGVAAKELAKRGAFDFAATIEQIDASPWTLLERDDDPDVVPAIGDAASVQWTLKKALGDTIQYIDEAGRPFRVRIVATVRNSILQGDLLISEAKFRDRFPSASGHRVFLVDAPRERLDEVAKGLSEALEDVGLQLTPTAERLRAFQAVQNTYLLIFQLLGGLGLLLGSVGLGMVVLRNALERRSELGLLRAVGWSTSTVRGLVWREHAVLLAAGLGCGVVAALLALAPLVLDGRIDPLPMLGLIVAVALSGLLWVALASRAATQGPLLDALRDD